MNITREQLIKASQTLNRKYVNSKTEWTPIDGTRQCAIDQVDHLLKVVKQQRGK